MTNPSPVELVVVPCLQDNYAYLVHNDTTGETALFDAPEAAPIRNVLSDRGWVLSDIVITHHHYDHVDAVADLRGTARVVGAANDAHRLPPLDLAVTDGDVLSVAGQSTQVFDVSGHTVGHVAYYMPNAALAFTADSLMAMGCGRLFEGTAEQMWASLARLRDLPDETHICSGHEYTQSNMRFARSIEPDNNALISRQRADDALRAKGAPTVPSVLSLERLTNPFLRADDPDVAAAVGKAGRPAAEVFAEVRARKDRF